MSNSNSESDTSSAGDRDGDNDGDTRNACDDDCDCDGGRDSNTIRGVAANTETTPNGVPSETAERMHYGVPAHLPTISDSPCVVERSCYSPFVIHQLLYAPIAPRRRCVPPSGVQ